MLMGDESKKSPVPALVITAAIVGAVSGGAFWWKHQPQPPASPEPTATATATATPTATGTVTAPPAAPAPVPVVAAPAPVPANLKAFTVTIHGALESAIVEATSK